MKVLIVEDDRDIRESIAMILELCGFEVHTAEHGRVALELLYSGYTPDVILLDLMMPVLNGVEFLRIIRGDTRFAGLRVVVCTAFGNMRRRLMEERLAFHALIEKPVDSARLLAVLRDHDDTGHNAPPERTAGG